MRKFVCSSIALLLVACQPNVLSSTSVAVAPTPTIGLIASVTSVPTANPAASRTPTLPPTSTFTPTLTPTLTLTSTLTPTATLTHIPSNTPILPTTTPIPSATSTDPANNPDSTLAPSWTPPPADSTTEIADHYRLRRPIGEGGVNYVARTYTYGSNAGGLQVHLGVDLENPSGTPILAAADGTIIYAGDDSSTKFGPKTVYYGNLVVIQHGFVAADGRPVFTLYGHMQRVDVQTGQSVKQGEKIGIVGATGVAFGPHLHFEVRLGDAYDYRSTRNPELWIYPFRKYGTLVGRVTDANGVPLYNAPLQVKSVDITRYAFSYADDVVNPDQIFNENFVLGDLPANYYEVSVNDNGRVRFRKLIYVYADRSTWIDIQLK
ncbi:MAG: peptidoglycan DD-metalloendopeptidase family protein [Anaerolineae bacterium]